MTTKLRTWLKARGGTLVSYVALVYVVLFLVFSELLPGVSVAEEGVTTDPTLAVSPAGDLVINTVGGVFGSVTQTINVTTTNYTGYTLTLETSGSSTNLVKTDNPSAVIPTITLGTGQESKTSSQLMNEYGFSLDGTNYLPVPDVGEPITIRATEESNSEPDTTLLTFGATPGVSAEYGTYTNQFVITAFANPYEPEPACPAEYICYSGNGDDRRGTMPNQVAESETTVGLMAPNFSRPGYGFAGWNTMADGSGTNYGPNQTITVGDLSEEGMILYARWIASSGLLQNWTGCGTLSTGAMIALTDFRDNETYTILKQQDGKCWMAENSRLNPETGRISGANTNNPTEAFKGQATVTTSSNTVCNTDDSACTDKVAFNTNNINRGLTANPTAHNTTSSWWSYGVDYNWYTATAGNGTISVTSGSVAGDICPAGWRLPTGGSSGEIVQLNNTVNAGNLKGDSGLIAYPTNFVHSGDFNPNATSGGRGTWGRLWSSTPKDAATVYRLGYASNAVTPTNAYNKWVEFPVRCVVKDDNVSVVGNVHYEANGGEGTMADDTNVNLYTAAARATEFTYPGFLFKSWNTASDGSGVTVAGEDMVAEAARLTNVSAGGTLTLYAIYGEIFTLTYDMNGNGDAPVQVEDVGPVASSHTFTISDLAPTREDFVLLGWSEDPDATTADYVHGDSYTTDDQNSTLYAVWGPDLCTAERICYRRNGGTAGIVQRTEVTSDTDITLRATDVSRPGYGFAGYSADPNAEVNTSDVIYGPNETISYSGAVANGLNLYAIWIPSAGNMQNFSGCSSMSTGEVTALTDTRDGEVYTVAKLEDGHCWMTENLRLIPSEVTFTVENTNAPTQDFITAAPTSAHSIDMCKDDNPTCINKIDFDMNNIDRALTPNPLRNDSASSWWSYGVYYNWYAATAGNGTYSVSGTNAVGDICPKGWRLPTGGNGGEVTALNNVVNSGSLTVSAGLRAYPNNFVYAGDHNGTVDAGRGSYGRYYTSTPNGSPQAYRLGFSNSDVTPVRSWKKWDAFTVRCVAKE